MTFRQFLPPLVGVGLIAMLVACSSDSTTTKPPTPSTANQWAWQAGANVANQVGTYGTLGTAASTNVPGARTAASGSTDKTGNLWLFGGLGYDSIGTDSVLNDLWKYSPGTAEWTWVGGSNLANQVGTYGTLGTAASANVPGARSAPTSWTDAAGNFWLFGGAGFDSIGTNSGDARLNDLWEYSAGEWTWVCGSNLANQVGTYGILGTAASTNMPGARQHALRWTDATGNLWLFGGLGYDSVGTNSGTAYLNDLWEFSPSTGEWTWMSGSNVASQVGTYGTMGTAANSNVPGARNAASGWVDTTGNLWLFGGIGYDSAGTEGGEADLNDLWEYSTSTGEWTWTGGSDTGNELGTYGTQGTAAASNVPGARRGAANWTDSAGNFWLFGGNGYDSAGTDGGDTDLNDLWEYSTSTGGWTWMGGSNTGGQLGTYGALGTAAASDVPGARQRAMFWIDSSGNFWLLGGGGYDSVGTNSGVANLNDLWVYEP